MITGKCDLEKFMKTKTSNVEWVDFDKVKGQIIVRKRRDGDVFVPIGKAGDVKVGKFLTKGRINYDIRSKTLVIEDSEKIVWLAPVRASEKTKVCAQTKTILEIAVTEL